MMKALLWLIIIMSVMTLSCSATVSTGQEESLAKTDRRSESSVDPEKRNDFSSLPSAELRPFQDGGLWGYMNGSGQVVIPPRYVVAEDFSAAGLAAVADGQKWMYIDRVGRTIVEPYVFDNGPDYFAEDLARFVRDGKFGFFDRKGQVVIEPRFDFAKPFSGGRAAVCAGGEEVARGEHRVWQGGRWGYIDRRGLLVIPMKFEAAGDFHDRRAEVVLQGEWREIDERGEIVR